jgi:membrane fusion protein, multidrug efflux system
MISVVDRPIEGGPVVNEFRSGRPCATGAWPAAISIALLAVGCAREAPTTAEVVRPVKTMVVATGGETHTRTFPAKVDASRKVELAFQVPGLLTQLPVKEGQNVTRGETIAGLRQDEFKARLDVLKAQLAKARAVLDGLLAGERLEQRLRLESGVRAAAAQLANARSEYDRAARLIQRNALAPAEYERFKLALKVADEEHQAAVQLLEKGTSARAEDIAAQQAEVRGLEARVVEANIQLGDSTLHAPFDGVIAKRFVQLNQNIKAGEPVVKFQDVDEIEVVIDVPETFMSADLRSADIVQITAEFAGAPGVEFPVDVREMAQRADPVTQTFAVRAVMKSPPGVTLLPGMTATASMTYRRAAILGDRILVPISAVYQDSKGEQLAWVLGTDATVSRRAVKLGSATAGQIEIVDGLRPGDRIAVAGVTFLRDGMKVRDLGNALGG